jgi:hypothetical protein
MVDVGENLPFLLQLLGFYGIVVGDLFRIPRRSVRPLAPRSLYY